MPIHPTAIVAPGAKIDESAEIGPYCVIGPHVAIGPNTRLMAHVVVDNHTTLGARNLVSPFAVLGGNPQDLKFKGEPSRLVIGDDNVIREAVTCSIGTAAGHMETRIGNGCMLMAYSHVAHDCRVGNSVILSNSVGLAGHSELDDYVIMNGISGLQQFCRIGQRAFVSGGAMIARDVPPFCVAKGDRAFLSGINIIGLRRAGWTLEAIRAMRHAFINIFLSDTPREVGLDKTERELAPQFPEVAEFCQFIRASRRGVCMSRRGVMMPAVCDDD
jgi:UDP-N-acetylglucosamine acyltransferase